MGDSTIFRIMWWQIAERGDGLLLVPVDHHLRRTAEEDVQARGFLFAAIGNVSVEFRSQIHAHLLDDRFGLGLCDGDLLLHPVQGRVAWP